MRTFVIVGHRATTSPDFSLDDIPGTSGRLDILCRCINAAFVLSHGIRRDVCVYLVLLGGPVPKTVRLDGEALRHLNPDERTTAALLKRALALEAGPLWSASTPGISVRSGGLEVLVEDLAGLRLLYLREDGQDIRSLGPLEGTAFILGDHTGMTQGEESLLERHRAEVVSVGPASLHSDHCMVIINNELDRREKRT
ncbi:MAG: tRNA (pseudouridine(54)-N(1))-methyltransferase TrmY [Methanothrix sp.]|nr:tRNA (pseudouridine(54)-N(1))-methyltransferase TrmY [Methanothrix sp.]